MQALVSARGQVALPGAHPAGGQRSWKRLGRRAIAAECGYFASFQQEIAASVEVPVFLSSLLQIPLAQQVVGANRVVGVLAALKKQLTEKHLTAAGVRIGSNYVVAGAQDDGRCPEFDHLWDPELRTDPRPPGTARPKRSSSKWPWSSTAPTPGWGPWFWSAPACSPSPGPCNGGSTSPSSAGARSWTTPTPWPCTATTTGMSNVVRALGGDWRNLGAEERYAFPPDWSVREYRIAEMRELTDPELTARLQAPFSYRGSTATLEGLARGKRSALVLFDDLSRWTPAYRLASPLVWLLERAGIEPSRIRFLAAVGSHRAMSREELAHKLGRDILARYRVSNHDCFSDDVVELGTGAYGTPLRLAREVVEAELVIGLGMLSAHGFAYASGGSKILLPGVAHVDTIRRNHRSSQGGRFEPGELKGDEEERRYGPIRAEMNQAAALLLERTEVVVVNAVLSRERGIAELAIGDPLAVLEQAEPQLERYAVPFARADKADIGVFRVDSVDPLQYYKGLAGPGEVCDHRIVVGNFSDRFIYQGQRHGSFAEHQRRLAALGPLPNPPLREALADPDTVFLCSPNLDRVSARAFSPSFYVAPDWDVLLAELRRELGPGRRAAFFPDSYLQILKIT